MKYPPRFPSRQRPPRETPAPPRRLLAGGIFVAGFLIAVLGAFHDVRSTGKEPITHLPPYSPLPTAGSFQVLGNPKPSASSEASPSPIAVLQLRQQRPTPALAVALPPANAGVPPVQNWSSASVLAPGVPAAGVSATQLPAVVVPQGEQADPTSTQQPSSQLTTTPTATAVPTPTPTPQPSLTPTPQPSTTPTPTPQPSPSGSPSCVPTKHHPCKQRGDTR